MLRKVTNFKFDAKVKRLLGTQVVTPAFITPDLWPEQPRQTTRYGV